MRILAQLDVPGSVTLLPDGVEAPAAGVAISGAAELGAAVFVDGHQVGALVGHNGVDTEEVYIEGLEEPVETVVLGTHLVVELELPPRWLQNLTADQLSAAVREVRLERARMPADGPVFPFDHLPAEDRRAWLDCVEAVRRIATSAFAASSEAPKSEPRA